MRTIKRVDLERRVLDALEHHLMDPGLVEAFCKEYTAERNRLQDAALAGRGNLEKELARVRGSHAKLVDAIVAGIPAEQVKDRMLALDARRRELEAALSSAPASGPVRFHPSMALTYRDRVGALIRGLGDAAGMEEAKEALRALVDRIVLTPAAEGEGLTIELHGALAGLLRLATGAEALTPPTTAGTPEGDRLEGIDSLGELVLVAGVGFEPTTFRL